MWSKIFEGVYEMLEKILKDFRSEWEILYDEFYVEPVMLYFNGENTARDIRCFRSRKQGKEVRNNVRGKKAA